MLVFLNALGIMLWISMINLTATWFIVLHLIMLVVQYIYFKHAKQW